MVEPISTEPIIEKVEEEVKEPVVEPVDNAAVKDVEEKIEDAKDELKDDELTPKQRDKVQARIDNLISLVNKQTKEIDDLKGKVEKPKEEASVWTEEKLIEVITDSSRPQSEIAWAQRELNKLDTKKMLSEIVQSQGQFAAKQASVDRAAEELSPDFNDKDSELWKAANKIYVENGFENIKDGQYIAAQLAMSRSKTSTDVSAAVLQKRLDKVNAKNNLVGGGRKAPVTNEASFEKIKKQALADGPDSASWKAWQKQVAMKVIKKI